MNCKTFNDLLHEYLDETLDADVQAAAREHLEHCGDCRRALMREETFAKSLRHALDRATADLSVRPETRRNVLNALEPTPSNAWLHAWRSVLSIRPARVGAAIAFILLLFLGIQLSRRTAKDSVSQPITQASHDTCVIDVPVQTRTYVFRVQNNMVTDAIATSVTVGHAGLFDDREPPRQPSPKSL